tara:strand:+ start:1423 stop:2568 length:1146 start_codon:yes stop_codon:yes gene_type:complete
MVQIDFSKLINDYNSNLTDKLRGFGEEEYLRFWVPDTIKVKSIFNLVDAIFESNTNHAEVFNLNLSNEELEKLQVLKSIAFSILEKEKISIYIDRKKYTDYKTKKLQSNKVKSKERNFKLIENLPIIDADEVVDEFYRITLEKSDYKIKNKRKLNDRNNIKIIEFSKNQKIIFSLERNKNLIVDAVIEFEKENSITKILDLFCAIIKDKRLQEVAEHGVIYLEYEIQKMSTEKRSKIKGIFLPSNSGGLFNLLNLKLREIYSKYLESENIEDDINKDYYEINQGWLDLGFEGQKNYVNDILQSHVFRQFNINENDMKLLRVVLGNRLEFELSNNLKGDYEDNKLFKIEEILKNKIDKSIELVTIEEKDSNKLRLSNAPKSV